MAISPPAVSRARKTLGLLRSPALVETLREHSSSLATPDRLARFRPSSAAISSTRNILPPSTAHGWQSMERLSRRDDSIVRRATPGAVGNAWSHLTLWERNEKHGAGRDDLRGRRHPPLGFQVETAELLAAPASWDIVLWGWNFDSLLSAALLPICRTALVFNQDAIAPECSGIAQTQSPQLFKVASGARRAAIRFRRAAGTAPEVRDSGPRNAGLLSVDEPDCCNSTLDIMLNGAYSARSTPTSSFPAAR